MSEGEKHKKKEAMIGMTSIIIAGILMVSAGTLAACSINTTMQVPPSEPASRSSSTANSEEPLVSSSSSVEILVQNPQASSSSGVTPPVSSQPPVSPSSMGSTSLPTTPKPQPTGWKPAGNYITQEGNYTDTQKYAGSVYLTADNVLLSNKVIEGSLFINLPKEKGYVDLINVVVKGDIVIQDGSPIVTMDNVTATSLQVSSKNGTPTVEIRNATEFTQTIVTCDALLRESLLYENNGGFHTIFLNNNPNKYWYELYLDVQGDQVVAKFPTNIRLLGNTSLSHVYAQKPIHLYDTGKAEHLYVESAGVSYANVLQLHENNGYVAQLGGVGVENNLAVATSIRLDTPVISQVPQTNNGVASFWFTGVKNASYYEINTYKNGVLVSRHQETVAPGAKCVVVSDLGYVSGDYVYFEVTAVGDGVNHLNATTVATSWISL